MSGRTRSDPLIWLDIVEVYVCVDLPAMLTYWDCALSSVVYRHTWNHIYLSVRCVGMHKAMSVAACMLTWSHTH